MSITLNSPHTIILAPEKTKVITTITITRTVDIPGQKIVKAFIQELSDPIILWEGTAYDEIGQWTDSDVTSRINTLYNS